MLQPIDVLRFLGKVLIDAKTSIEQTNQELNEYNSEVGEGGLEWPDHNKVEEEYNTQSTVASHHGEGFAFKSYTEESSQEQFGCKEGEEVFRLGCHVFVEVAVVIGEG